MIRRRRLLGVERRGPVGFARSVALVAVGVALAVGGAMGVATFEEPAPLPPEVCIATSADTCLDRLDCSCLVVPIDVPELAASGFACRPAVFVNRRAIASGSTFACHPMRRASR